MEERSTFESLPDEMILQVCCYLRGVDVLYSFFDLNARLNITISGYCRYINLLTASYQPFEYVVSHVIPRIGTSVRSFVLNGNWKTIVSTEVFTILFASSISIIFPQLQRLTLKWFTGERLSSVLNSLQDLPQLVKLDICLLKGQTEDNLLTKILASNNGRLVFVSFDPESVHLNVSETDETVLYLNIEELTININLSQQLARLFTLIPNVRRLYVTLNEISDYPEFKQPSGNVSPLVHLIDFKLSSINLFWTLDEIMDVLRPMPCLQKLTLDLCTEDERLVTGDNLLLVLPLSVTQVHVFISYHISESNLEKDALTTSWPAHLPITSLLDEARQSVLLHTVPLNLHSLCLPAEIGKQVSSGWKSMQHVKHLFVYDATSLNDILFLVQHFHRLQTLTIHAKNDSETLAVIPVAEPIILRLPCLKKLEVLGICALFDFLKAAPNLDYLDVQFDCLKSLLDDEPTCHLLQQRIIRLDVGRWLNIESDLLQHISQVFRNLRHFIIQLEDSEMIVDPMILAVLAHWKDKQLFSFTVSGPLSDQAKQDLRQWLIDQTHLTTNHCFAVEYDENWFDLWM